MRSFFKNILILAALIAVAGAGYYLVVAERGATIDANDALSVNNAERETQAFLRRLNDLRSIELSAALFSDPRFTTLTDFTQPVDESTPVGRSNPFAR